MRKDSSKRKGHFVIFAAMETIPKSDCEKIGFFRKTHGVRGELVLEFEIRFENSIEMANRFFVELEGLLVPFFLVNEGFRFKTDNTAILTFEDVDTEKYAKRMVGCAVYLFKNEMKTPGKLYTLDLEGFVLFDKRNGKIGIIDEVNDYSGNIVFTINLKGSEILIPFNEDFLISFDEKKKHIMLDLPEGLFEQ